MSQDQITPLEYQALKKGKLWWRLYRNQYPIYEALLTAKAHRRVLNCTRQLGKTTIMLTIACEAALDKPRQLIRLAAGKAKQLGKAIHPTMGMLFADAPESVKPRWHVQDGCYRFPNGSEIHIAGADSGHADDLRGSMAHMVLIDEAGFIAELEYLVNSILSPQLVSTGGPMIIASTPPVEGADHYFYKLFKDAEAEGAAIHKTIYDTHYGPETIAQKIKESGGEHTATWRREWLAEFTVDQERAVVPEFNLERNSWDGTTPDYYPYLSRYASCDIGTRDLTALVLGYYDQPKAQLIIQDERIIGGPTMTTELLATTWKEAEAKLWADKKPVSRKADSVTDLLVNDLSQLHDLPCSKPDKDQLHAMVNEMREWTQSGRIKIAKHCVQTIGCLQYGVWDLHRKDFSRSKAHGHLDALAALMYMVRSVDTNTNPVPKYFNKSIGEAWSEERLAAGRKTSDKNVVEDILNVPNYLRKAKRRAW